MHSAAMSMLTTIIEEKWLKAHGIVGLFRASSVGDDIKVYSETGEEQGTFFGLRQQVVWSHHLKQFFLVHCSTFWVGC